MNNDAAAGLAIGLLWILAQLASDRRAAAAPLPAPSPTPSSTPAGDFGAQLDAAMAAEDLRGISPRCLKPVGILETANGSGRAYKRSNNAFSIHAIESWGGSCYVTGRGEIFSSYAEAARVVNWDTEEILRVYPDLRASVRDMVREVTQNPRYRVAAAQGRAGNVDAFVRALVFGDGQRGWVGDPNAPKAYAYINAAASIAGRIA